MPGTRLIRSAADRLAPSLEAIRQALADADWERLARLSTELDQQVRQTPFSRSDAHTLRDCLQLLAEATALASQRKEEVSRLLAGLIPPPP